METDDFYLLNKYFQNLTPEQQERFSALKDMYAHWNAQINVISRKDMDAFYAHHVLHSLGIAKIISFKSGTKILDIGTGGGFPGIPLAILFPETDFFLIDSIGKKTKVVNEIKNALQLKNVKIQHGRAEQVNDKFDFAVSRAVADFTLLYTWAKNKIKKESFNPLKNGMLCLKGGDLNDELKNYKNRMKLYNLHDFFKEDFFKTKQLVYFPV